MAGKDGSTWRHDYVPTNAAAAALKAHKTPGGSTTNSFLPVPASFSGPKGTGPKGAKGTALAKARAAKAKPKPTATTAAKKTTAKAPAKPKAAAKPQHDLTTREGRARAVASANISTPQGRALVAKAQRASLDTTPVSHIPGSSVKPPKAPRKPATPKTTADPMAALLKLAKPKGTPAKAAAPKTADDYLKRAPSNAPAKAAAAPSGKTTEQRILDAMPELSTKATGFMSGSGYVPISDVRDHLTAQGVAPREADRAMVSLYQKQDVNLTSAAALKLITPAQRATPLHVGGMDKHMISTEGSVKAAHTRLVEQINAAKKK